MYSAPYCGYFQRVQPQDRQCIRSRTVLSVENDGSCVWHFSALIAHPSFPSSLSLSSFCPSFPRPRWQVKLESGKSDAPRPAEAASSPTQVLRLPSFLGEMVTGNLLVTVLPVSCLLPLVGTRSVACRHARVALPEALVGGAAPCYGLEWCAWALSSWPVCVAGRLQKASELQQAKCLHGVDDCCFVRRSRGVKCDSTREAATLQISTLETLEGTYVTVRRHLPDGNWSYPLLACLAWPAQGIALRRSLALLLISSRSTPLPVRTLRVSLKPKPLPTRP